jgi:hypothetical protein
MSLGDLFPKRFREEHATRNLKEGSVLKMFVDDTTPPKEKRFIIVGFSGDRAQLATIYINSEINLQVNYSPELQSLHLFMQADGRDFLDHNSFVDCSQLTQRDVSAMYETTVERPDAVIGVINDDELLQIRRKLAGAPTIKKWLKMKYGLISN